MTVEQYFKDHINWKIYNYILDASTELDDRSIHHVLSIEVCDTAFGQEIYHSIYTEHNGYIDYDKDYIQDYIDNYKENGFVYTLLIEHNFHDYENVINKIRKRKDIKYLHDTYNVFRFKEK